MCIYEALTVSPLSASMMAAENSGFETPMPALHFANVPDALSKATSPPTANSSLPTAPANSTMGVGVKPKLELKPT
eukprot:Gb_20070 [translate_table: standard]